MLAQMLVSMPHVSEVSKTKKENLLRSFQELELTFAGHRQGVVLENEGSPTNYVYWILRGEVHLYRKIKPLYEQGENLAPTTVLQPMGKPGDS